MDLNTVFHYLAEFAYILIIFGTCLIWAIFAGRQSLINLICGVYLSSLLIINFVHFEMLTNGLEKPLVVAGVKIVVFIILVLLITKLFKKLMPREYLENKFESFGKKVLLATLATILLTAVSLTIIPVTDFITPNTFLLNYFADSNLFFWWLLLPLILLFLN